MALVASSVALTPVCAPETVTSWLDWTTLEVPVAAATAPVVVFGEGCGNEAGAGLAAVAFCGRFFGVAPRFSDFRPRPVYLRGEREIEKGPKLVLDDMAWFEVDVDCGCQNDDTDDDNDG